MKTTTLLLALLCLTGCVFPGGSSFPKANLTDVRLEGPDFEVTDTGIRGGDTGFKILGIGLCANYSTAMDRIREKARLKGGARAIVNVTEDAKTIWWLGPIIVTDSIDLSADVVEFKRFAGTNR